MGEGPRPSTPPPVQSVSFGWEAFGGGGFFVTRNGKQIRFKQRGCYTADWLGAGEVARGGNRTRGH